MRIQTSGNADGGISRPPAWVRGGRERFHTKARLEAILQRERARADRSGRQFSLVVFSVAPGQTQGRVLYRLARTVVRRVRITDDVGHFGDGSVAAVLPETPGTGAWKLAQDIMEALDSQGMPVEVCVYTYPSGRSGHPWTTHHPDPGGYRTDPNISTPVRAVHHESRDPQRGSSWEADPVTWNAACRLPTKPLEALLLRPIPRWKRAIDVWGAVVGLVLLLPVLIAAGLAIKISSPGPMLFVQLRAGRGGQPFRMYKFRTMYAGAEHRRRELSIHSEQDGPAFKMRNDPRVTAVGRWLRKASIDELPQLWNVLKGEMSLVGPRPLPCHEAEGCHHWHHQRHSVLPGLTCIWQVRGRSRVSFDEWMRMDAAYVRSLGVVRDLLILLQTIPAVLLQRGAS